MARIGGKHETFRRSIKDKGARSLKSLKRHPAKKREGEIMSIARSPIVTMAPTMPIYDAVQIMVKQGFRRIPIADPGTKKLEGIITATDIVDYFGGGDKFQIIQQKYAGNFFKAINEPIKTIMTREIVSIQTTAKIADAIRLMTENNVGGLPVVDNEGRIWAIVTERDIVNLLKDKISGVKVKEIMSKDLVTVKPETSIYDAVKIMTTRGFRRLPIASDKKLVGILTVMDVMRYFTFGGVFKNLRSSTITQVLQTSIMEIATKNVITIDPEKDLGYAAKLMQENKIGALVVVEDNNLVGIITERDFFKTIA
ncbi:MAG: CBS domain-containing protein [Candidatus Bathyarchaeia archaeon]